MGNRMRQETTATVSRASIANRVWKHLLQPPGWNQVGRVKSVHGSSIYAALSSAMEETWGINICLQQERVNSTYFTVQKAIQDCNNQALPGRNSSELKPKNRPSQLQDQQANLERLRSYLKRSQTQLEADLVLVIDGHREDGKHNVVDPKERDEQQGGLGQSPRNQAGESSSSTDLPGAGTRHSLRAPAPDAARNGAAGLAPVD